VREIGHLFKKHGELMILKQSIFLVYFLGQAKNASVPKLKEIFAEGGGLITNRTVDQMLWNVTDPLLVILKPNLANARLSVNYTSYEDVYQNQNLSTCFTGKNDTTKIMWFVQENGVSVVTGFSQNITVEGTNSDGQFQPFMEDYTQLFTWNDQYARLITLVPTEWREIQGIDGMIYMVDNSTWNQNQQFTNDFEGFVNITAVKHAPVFMGNPHMFLADESWGKKLKGILPPDPVRDQTTAGVEPNTGKTIMVSKVLQVNVYVPQSSNIYALFDPKLPTDVMYPVMWVHQTAEITPKLAEELKKSLISMIKLKSFLLTLFVPVGGFFLLLGTFVCVIMGLLGYRFTKPTGYIEIN